MDKFIALSEKSQECLKSAMLSASLPVNVILIGPKAVGKNHLAKLIAPKANSFEAKEFEELLFKDSFELESLREIIIFDIHKIVSLKNILQNINIKGLKIIATSLEYKESYRDIFQVKIEVPSLQDRKEDVEFLKKEYIKKAKRLFLIEDEIKEPKLDLSNNAISLKKSIFSSILFDSLSQSAIEELLENFFLRELDERSSYKELLPIFEKPLLKATKSKFHSQLQMAKKLDINRNTLRKKLHENGLDG